MQLNDTLWTIIKPHIPPLPVRADGRGRRWNDPRAVLDGILWVRLSGANWQDMPERYSPFQTCHRWFQRWVGDGTLERILEAIAGDLEDRRILDFSECFIDGTFASAKKEGLCRQNQERQGIQGHGHHRAFGVAYRRLRCKRFAS